MKIKSFLKSKPLPKGKIEISKIYCNKKNGQMMILLPKRKIKIKSVPSKVEVIYWK